MGYIGNEPTTGHFPVDNFTSSGGSTYTLAKAPASAGAIEVSVQGVLQPTTAYTVSGTTLTMAGVTTGVKIFVRHLGETLSLPTPADGGVTAAKLGVNSVDGTKIAMGSDAAGDILYHGATDYARLAKGTAGQALVMNAGATAPEWGEAGGGKVLQCVYTSKLDEFVGASTSWADVTGMTVTTGAIASTSSRVLVTCALYIYDYTAAAFLKITDGSGGDITGFIGAVAGASQIRASSGSIYQAHTNVGRHVSLQLMDTTASVSARTYKLRFLAAAGGTVRMNRTSTDTNGNSWGRSVSSIMATEIGA